MSDLFRVVHMSFFSRFGAGTKGPINMLSQYMIGSAASFGFFMCKFLFYSIH